MHEPQGLRFSCAVLDVEDTAQNEILTAGLEAVPLEVKAVPSELINGAKRHTPFAARGGRLLRPGDVWAISEMSRGAFLPADLDRMLRNDVHVFVAKAGRYLNLQSRAVRDVFLLLRLQPKRYGAMRVA